jgi:hypothetical protein
MALARDPPLPVLAGCGASPKPLAASIDGCILGGAPADVLSKVMIQGRAEGGVCIRHRSGSTLGSRSMLVALFFFSLPFFSGCLFPIIAPLKISGQLQHSTSRSGIIGLTTVLRVWSRTTPHHDLRPSINYFPLPSSVGSVPLLSVRLV